MITEGFISHTYRIISLLIIHYALISAAPAVGDEDKGLGIFVSSGNTQNSIAQNESLRSSAQIQFPDDDGKSQTLSELCPGLASNLYRYDQKARKCSQVGTEAHCGKNMIFYSFNDSRSYGHCDCDYNRPAPLIYHPMTSRCYYVYQQAYCKVDEWLELNVKTGKASCTPNKCFDIGRTTFGAMPLASRDTIPEYVPLNGQDECVKLNQSYDKCDEGEVVKFHWPKKPYAQCNPIKSDAEDKINGKGLSVPGLQCEPGTYLTIVGRCQPAFDFDE